MGFVGKVGKGLAGAGAVVIGGKMLWDIFAPKPKHTELQHVNSDPYWETQGAEPEAEPADVAE